MTRNRTSSRSRSTKTRRTRQRAETPGRALQAPLVVGLTGPNASGKGEVAKFLAAHGLAVHSLSDVVRDEATRRGLDHTRDELIHVGVLLRTEGGTGALARRVMTRLRGPAVVDSIRNPGEVEALRTLRHFVLLGVDAPQALRFERSLLRGRRGDGATLDEFARKEARENATTEAGQQLVATLALADAVIDNDGTIRRLHARVRRALAARGIDLRTGCGAGGGA